MGRDVDPLDWVARTESNTARGIYFTRPPTWWRGSWRRRSPGSIIPVQIGAGEGRRDDYLFQKLDLV